MISITAQKIGDRYYVKSVGHAGYDEPGKDIVCSAVSTLIQSFAMVAGDYQDKGEALIRRLIIDDALCHIEVDSSSLASAFDMLKVGLESIADSYPKNVCLGD